MLKIVDDKQTIADAQKKFEKSFKSFGGETINTTLNSRGGNYDAEVLWFDKPGFWVCFAEIGNRYWNAFGTLSPEGERNVHITCEINFPKSGIGRKIGGAFVKDASEKLYMVHRGNMGGGKKGIGKRLFLNNYRGDFEIVQDGEQETELPLIGALDSGKFIEQIHDFIREVERIKSIPQQQIPQTLSIPQEFNKEFTGKRKYKTSEYIEAKCNHGLIVNALADELKRGLKTANTRSLDLCIIGNQGNKITHVFEVKTDISTTSLYSAVGQLLLNSVCLPSKPKLILVIPEKLGRPVCEILKELGIKLLIFQWKGDNVIFPDLASVI